MMGRHVAKPMEPVHISDLHCAELCICRSKTIHIANKIAHREVYVCVCGVFYSATWAVPMSGE
jgi:hypothetical protein